MVQRRQVVRTPADTCNTTAGSTLGIGQYDNLQTYAGTIISDNANAKCRLELKLWKVGSPTDTYKIEIWTDDGGAFPDNRPQALVSGQSYSFNPANITPTDQAGAETSPTSFTINWTPAGAGVKYWLLIYKTTSGDSASDYIATARRDNCTPDGAIVTADEVQGTWSLYSQYYNLQYVFYE